MKIEFSTDSAAFCDQNTGEKDHFAFLWEYNRIMTRIQHQVESGMKSASILDSNGNKIGRWSI